MEEDTTNKINEEEKTVNNPERPRLSPEDVAEIRRQVMEQLRTEQEQEKLNVIRKREEEQKAREDYIKRMHESDEPWVDIRGWVETSQGVKVELDWNTAFVEHLKKNGITGADDNQIVQRWVTLLLRDMADEMDDQNPGESKFS